VGVRVATNTIPGCGPLAMHVSAAAGIHIFTISPQTKDTGRYWQEILNVAEWSDELGWTGTLLFTGNDTYLEPWVVAQALLARTRALSPLVAVNPVYMHPFTVAKTLASLSRLYGRKLHLNLVTGTALNHLDSLGDRLSHDERYDRLCEFAVIVRELVASPRPLTFDGRFYRLDNVQLLPAIPPELWPEFVIAGHSEAARRACRALGAVGIQMLTPTLTAASGVRGIHFGIITRPDDEAAARAAREQFPEGQERRAIQDRSMRNTDSHWKRELHDVARQPDAADAPYSLAPFRNFHADCPYLVGSYDCVAEIVRTLIAGGVDTFVLDIPARKNEFEHVRAAWELASHPVHRAPV
jgi:alkanesulfonate monooxygenase